MLDDAGARPAIENSPNPRNNPLVALPMPASEVINGVGAVLVTHTHSDHWDPTAARILPKTIPLFGSPKTKPSSARKDSKTSRRFASPFTGRKSRSRVPAASMAPATLAKPMAPVSGFILQAAEQPTFYIAGDTIWCDEVETALRKYKPQVVVVNTGAAQFLKAIPSP